MTRGGDARRQGGQRLRAGAGGALLAGLGLCLASQAFLAQPRRAAWAPGVPPRRAGAWQPRSRRPRTAAAAESTRDGDWTRLKDWITDTGVDTSDITVEVAPVELAPGELGLVATQRMEPGDILAWTPAALLLNRDKAVALFGDIVEDLPQRLSLALFLLHERLVKGKESVWAPYWDNLPKWNGDVSGPSFLWSEEEWEYLDGSDGYAASVQMAAAIEGEYESLKPLFEKHPETFPAEVYTYENFLWASAVIASRAYGDDTEGSYLSIAPLVDFLNHGSGALQLTRFGNGIVAYAHKAYDPGEEVYVSYGGKNNAQLITQYGFVMEVNAEESVYLRMEEHLFIQEPHVEAKRQLLSELLGEDDRDPSTAIFRVALRQREWISQLIPALRILALSENDAVPESVVDLRATQQPKHEAAAWDLMVKALKLRLEEYPFSLEDHRKQLAEENVPERKSLGLRLLISEQELIQLAVGIARENKDTALAAIQKADA